jgi:hypothetical protein
MASLWKIAESFHILSQLNTGLFRQSPPAHAEKERANGIQGGFAQNLERLLDAVFPEK